jgi:hypothetical protein
VHADEKLSAFVKLDRQVLTVMFYLASIHADSCRFMSIKADDVSQTESAFRYKEFRFADSANNLDCAVS